MEAKMPKQKRFKTKYPGTYYIRGVDPRTGKPERIYYIMYRKDGKLIEEKAGRQHMNDMSPARAAKLRADRMSGAKSNKERREAAEAAKLAEEGRWTMSRLWAAYKEAKPDLKGVKKDESRWVNHIEPVFGDKEPADLVPLDIDRVRVRLLKKYSPQTVKHILSLLRRILRWGAGRGLVEPIHFEIEFPRVDNQTTEDLSPEQLTRLLEAIEADPHPHAGPLMKLALFTGMRKAELLRLEWRHLDFQGGFIFIEDPKGGRSVSIPMNEAAKELLEKHPETSGSPFVFPGRGGRRWVEIRKPVDRIRKAAKLPPKFRPLHGLRHVYASMLASSGQVDMYTLQKLLTHKSPSVTQRYSHLRDEALRKAAELGPQLIDEARKSLEAQKRKVVNLHHPVKGGK
jgi:integrase